MNPQRCPICESNSIKRMLSDVLLSAHFPNAKCPSSGVVAYHCAAGHVFLLLNENFHWKAPVPEGSGHSFTV